MIFTLFFAKLIVEKNNRMGTALKKDCHGPWHCKAGERITWLTPKIYVIIGKMSRIAE